MRALTTILFFFIILGSCNPKPEIIETNDLPTHEEKFNEAFKKLFLKYQKDYIVRPSIYESKKPSDFLEHKLTLKTNFLDLNYSLYVINNSCGDCWDFKVIYIYNDSISYAMPLWDDYYYWSSATENEQDLQKTALQNLTFEQSLKEFIGTISNSKNSAETTREVINAIMMLNGHPHFDIFSICQIETFIDFIQINTFYDTPACNTALKNSIVELKELTEFTDNNTLLFGKVMMIHVFHLTNDDRLFNFKVLNHECMREILM
jgi:hypothetical protein